MDVITYWCPNPDASLTNLLSVKEDPGAEIETFMGNLTNSVV